MLIFKKHLKAHVSHKRLTIAQKASEPFVLAVLQPNGFCMCFHTRHSGISAWFCFIMVAAAAVFHFW